MSPLFPVKLIVISPLHYNDQVGLRSNKCNTHFPTAECQMDFGHTIALKHMLKSVICLHTHVCPYCLYFRKQTAMNQIAT